ncbi:unnamed protein product [Rotaria sp. Silwood1]|nr:unnamed protein product [Rotaria sp. Silwood1]CAF5073432.1 unnamed protein product [Rotaria sp. Silwood1]
MKMNNTTFESLSNELFLDLFELFNGIDLFRAFDNLNIRFNSLLFIYFRNNRIDLRSILKKDFDIFCQKYLRLILNHTIYLRISDDEDTPFQYTNFLSAGFTLGQFNNLRSLTFNCVSSDRKMNQSFFSDLYRLNEIKNLKFVDCRLYNINIEDFNNIINQIWNLSKLTHLYWDCRFESNFFSIPTNVSKSLQYLTVCKPYWYSSKFVY